MLLEEVEDISQVSISDKQQAHCAHETYVILVCGFCSQNFDETVNGCGDNL